jgi:FixJ family two-component response regulator
MKAPDVVFIVDDDSSVLKAMARLLSAEGYEPRTFSSPRAFLDAHDPEVAGCILMDVSMPGCTGLELQHALHDARSVHPIVFLTGAGDIRTSVKAIQSGAVDFLTKPVDDEELLSAIGAAMVRDRADRGLKAEQDGFEARLAALTPREREVMGHVVAGRLNKQIAGDLGIAEKTIKVHRARVMEKMRAGSVAELARMVERASRPRGGTKV